MEFKNAVEDVEKLYQSCSFNYHRVVSFLQTAKTPNMFEQSFRFFKDAVTSKKAVDVMSVGYKDLIPETKTIKSIRKTFAYTPEDSVGKTSSEIQLRARYS